MKENSYIYSTVPGNRLNINLNTKDYETSDFNSCIRSLGWHTGCPELHNRNSEKVFKSIDAYNTALSTLDKLAEQYQDLVDAKFAEVETLYNNYMNQKASLTAATRQARENDILAKEKAAQEYQETLFGNDGTLMKKRIEMIEPIQKQDLFRDRSLCPNRWCRRGARFGQQPDAALLEPQCGSYAAGYRRPQKNRIIKTLTDNL